MKINWNNDDEASVCGRNLGDAVKNDFGWRELTFEVKTSALVGTYGYDLRFE